MPVSRETANYLVRRWYMEELNRVPKPDEQKFHADVVLSKGVDVAFAGIYDSPDAKKHRAAVGRKV